MLRKLAIAIAASGALMSATSVHALGMGDIELDSALNQPLDAHIRLLKAGELEDWEIKPDLAANDEFQKSGIERVFFLNNVKFEIERSDDGVFIKLSTQEAVVEPFLNFLVQVDWPNGRLLREYTLLLDPPVYVNEPTKAVAAPRSEGRSSGKPVMGAEESGELDDIDDYVEPGSETEPASGELDDIDDYVEPGSEPEPVLDEYVEPESNLDDYTEAESEIDGSMEPEQQIYEVRANDTLWEVALKTRPSRSISPQQAMLAIQDLNPDSFISGNINRLKKDQVLRIPSEEQINARGFREAISEVAVQNQFINKRNAQLDATRKDETLAREEEVKGAELKLLTGGEATSETQRSASGEVMSSTEGDQSTLDNELSLALDNLDKSQRDNTELSNRLDALEEQINTLQRIINLKDEQMVALQAGFSQQDSAEMVVVDEAPEPQVSMEFESELDSELAVVSAVTEGVEQKADLNFSSPEEEMKKEATPKPEAKPAPVVAAPELEEEFDAVALVMDNIGIFGGALGALLLTLLLVSRSRKNKEEEQDDAVEMASFDGLDPLEDVSEGLGANLDDEFSDLEMGEDIDDLAGGDLESEIDSADVSGLEGNNDKESEAADVLGEVEIYIAYDRMDQARSLLEKTIEAQPGRMDVRVKLLEVLGAIGDGESFSEHYDFVLSKGTEEDQGKAAGYREALNLDGSADESNTLNELGDELGLGDDLGLDGSSDLNFDGIELSSEEGDLNFDLDGLGLDDEPASELDAELSDLDGSLGLEPSGAAGDDDLSLEFGSLDLGDDAQDGTISSGLDGQSSDIEMGGDLDLDLDFDVPELPGDELGSGDSDTALSQNSGSLSLDDELVDIDLSEDLADVELDFDADASSSSQDDLMDLDDMSLDLDSDVPLIETTNDMDLDLSEGLDFNLDEDLSGLEDKVSLDSSTDAPEIDLDLSDDDLMVDMADIEPLASSDNLSLTDSELDLDLSIDESDMPLIEGLDGDLLDDLDQLAVDLDVDDLAASAPIVEKVVDTGGKNVFDLPALEENDLDLTDLDGDLDFLSGTDESETKLDLARAYIDMDDQDGAREILQEVLEDGSEQQKQDATRLMDGLV